MAKVPHATPVNYTPEEFLSPEQRLDAIAEILATIALRAIKQSHEAERNQ